MPFFEKIGGKITDVSKDVAKKTKDLADINKLNSQISKEENEIKNNYTNIGKLYYELFSNSPDESFASLCASINESLSRIAECKNQIQAIKGIKKCPQCGAEIVGSPLFCGSCGCKINDDTQTAVDEPEKLECPNCKNPITSNSEFCTNCGTKLK